MVIGKNEILTRVFFGMKPFAMKNKRYVYDNAWYHLQGYIFYGQEGRASTPPSPHTDYKNVVNMCTSQVKESAQRAVE